MKEILNNTRNILLTFLLIFVLSSSAQSKDIESYDDLCRECQKYKNSYRLRGWVCWTACGSQNNSDNSFKQNEMQMKNIGGPEATTKRSRGKIKQKVKVASNVTKTQSNIAEMYNSNWSVNKYLSDSYLGLLLDPSKLIEILLKARCILPKDIDSITRAALLQQCFSRNQAQGNETICYEELGCFPMEKPWVTLLRPFPTPKTPDEIDTRLYLYTRNASERYYVQLWPTVDLSNSDFKPDREKTVFITHGFASDGNSTWMSQMKDAYLEKEDANVFLVDWGNGASHLNYLQVASNTRIVGAELSRFGKHLLNMGVKPETFHLIGHSLGSHISSYMAKNLANTAKLGRITGLDPAQPGFENQAKEVRLDQDDAEFVDVLHTDAKPFIPFIGFGLLLPTGHVDFYVNGGTNQPGCLVDVKVGPMKSIFDLAEMPVEVLSKLVSCSHGRAYLIFTEALRNENSCLWARKIPFFANLIKVTAMGALRLFDPFIESWDTCTADSCTTVGLITSSLKARGVFALSTTKQAPYCVTDEDRDRKIRNILSLGLISIGNRIVDGITSILTG